MFYKGVIDTKLLINMHIIYNTGLKSLICLNRNDIPNINNLVVKYQIGKWAYPNFKQTSLMCFDNLNDAKWFRKNYNLYQSYSRIFECKVYRPKEKGVYVNPGHLTAIFNYLNDGNKELLRDNYPFGTIFAEAIKLTKEIDSYV